MKKEAGGKGKAWEAAMGTTWQFLEFSGAGLMLPKKSSSFQFYPGP